MPHRMSQMAIFACVIALALAGSPFELRVTAQSESRLIVIVSRELGLRSIDFSNLRRVFGGEPSEAGGHRLIPFNYAPGNPIRTSFDRAVLKMGPEAVGRFWIDRKIRGQGNAPRVVSSPAIMRAIVTKLPGAIGYVTSDSVDHSVQALQVDGMDYTDAEYPLLSP